MAKTLYIKTYGCQMNVYDSDRMVDLLQPLGYSLIDAAGDADLVILNTCHIREKAAEKVYSELGRLRLMQQRRRAGGADMILAVAGCVAQAENEVMLKRAPFLDLVFGPQTYHHLPNLVAQAEQASQNRLAQNHHVQSHHVQNHHISRWNGLGVLDTEFPLDSKFDSLPAPTQGASLSAFLSIQEGCDKFCSFCVVPYTRGAEFSRPATEILREARRLAALGTRAITLLGQNVNGWHGEAANGSGHWSLARLLYALAEIEGIERLSYTTSHPRDMDAGLIAAHGALPQLMPWLHLPVQSGSNSILTAMNRQHTADQYRRLIDQLRQAQPALALSSDFIIGFPGETDSDFDATMGLISEIGYASAFSFKYSPRPGTPAAAMPQLSDAVKSARLTALQALLRRQQNDFNTACIGKVIPVLAEKPGRYAGQLVGRSPWMQPVHFQALQAQIGTIVPIHIDRTEANSLGGFVHGAMNMDQADQIPPDSINTKLSA